MLQSMLFDVMFLNRYGGHETTADTRMDQHPLQLVCNVDTCRNVYKLNNVSSSDVIVSQTQPGLLATAVPHSIQGKVCTLSPSLMIVNVVVYNSFALL